MNNKTSKLLFLALGIGLVIFLAGITIVGGLVIKIKDQETRKATITDEDLRVVTQGINFTDAGDENYIYKSPVLNFQLTVNTNTFYLIETSRGLYIYPQDYNYNNSAEVTVEQTKDDLEEEVDFFVSGVSYYEDGKVISNEPTTLDGVPAQKILYTRKSFSGGLYQDAALVSVKDGTVYTIVYKASAESYKDQEFSAIIDSFKFIDSATVDSQANYSSSLWGYSFSYNAKLWKIDASSNYSIYLSPREFSFMDENADDIEISITSDEITRLELLGNEATFLDNAVAERIDSLKNSSLYQGLEIGDQEVVQLAARRAIVLNYTIDTENEYLYEKNFREYLFLHYNTLTRIVVNYQSSESEAFQEFLRLIDSFAVTEPSSGSVKGASSDTTEEKSVVKAKPAVVRIFARSCGEVQIPRSNSLPRTSGKNYEVCAAGTGSGFFVNHEGYVATNGHVVIFGESEIVFNSVVSGYSRDLLINIFRDYFLPQLVQNDPSLANISDSEIMQVLRNEPDILQEIAYGIQSLVEEVDSDIRLETSVYVQKGTTPFIFGEMDLGNKSNHFEAEIIDYDYDISGLVNDSSSDVALLKVKEEGDYPTLTLGDTGSVNEGSSLLILGFPGIATDLSFVESDARGDETVTRGIVSAKKETDSGRLLIQTDASIQSGNSGGPGINSNAQVIGIATYALTNSGSADYNFLRDIEDLKALMSENNVANEIGKTETLWRSGIDHFFSGEFSNAVDDFEEANSNYPYLVETENFITVANQKIDQGLDVSGESGGLSNIFSNLSGTEKILFVAVSVLLCLVTVLILSTFAIILKLSSKVSKANLAAQQAAYIQQAQQPRQL